MNKEKAIEYLTRMKSHFNCRNNDILTDEQKEIKECFEMAIAALKATRNVGKWKYRELDNFRKYSVTCSACGVEYIDNYDGYIDPSIFEYCPKCGAKMIN